MIINQIKIKLYLKIDNTYISINIFRQYKSIDAYRFKNTGSNEFLHFLMVFFYHNTYFVFVVR